MTEEGLRADYDDARGWLDFIIDHPDKSVTPEEYRQQLEAAQQKTTAAHAALLKWKES